MSLSELGAYFQRHREEQGLSLEAVEEATRIRRVHLEAIEAGRWDSLPPGVYVRGLLKSYAKVLGLSPETVQRMYLKERPGEDAPAAPRNILSQPLLREPRLSMESVLAVVFIAAAAGIGWWLWLAFVGPMLRSGTAGTATVTVTAPAAATAQPTRQVKPTSSQGGVPTAVVLPTLESATQEPGATPEAAEATVAAATVAVAGTATSTASPRASAGPSAAPSRTAAASATPPAAVGSPGARTATPPKPAGSPSATQFAGGLRLSLRSTGSIWVSVVLDGKRPPAFEGFLRKGENDLWEGQARTVINLRTGNAGETEVSLNGQRLPSLGKAGEVKNVEWRLLPDGRVQQTP